MINSVSPAVNRVVDTCVKKPINCLAKQKFMETVCENFRKDKTGFLTGLAIASIAIKDGLGCYMYVTQSLHNKDIPEDKRKFVAALDLANGGLMIASQIGMALLFTLGKVPDKIFDKCFGKYFDRTSKKAYQAFLQNKPEFKDLAGKDFNKMFEKFHKTSKGTFAFFTTLMASTILAKRVIVPFISTPLADYAKDFLDKKGSKQKDGDSFQAQEKSN